MPRDARDAYSSPGRWCGWSGVGAVVAFSAGNALWAFEQPNPAASGNELIDFYGANSGEIVAGAGLSLFSIALLTIFAGALRQVLRGLGRHGMLADTAFGGILLGLAAGLGAETINMAAAIRAGDDALSRPLAEALFDTSYVLGSYAAGIGLGVMMIAVGVIAIQSRRLLPQWLAAPAVALGVVLATPIGGYLLGEYTVAPAFVLILIVSVSLLRRPPEREAISG
jgi:hypothetical protein